MSIGLFERQSSLNLRIPDDIIIYITSDTDLVSPETERLLYELVEALALVGTKTASLVFGFDGFGNTVGVSSVRGVDIHNLANRVQAFRPYFELIACDLDFLHSNVEAFDGKPIVVFHRPYEANLAPYHVDWGCTFEGSDPRMQEILEDELVLDFAHMLAARFTDPIFALYDLHKRGHAAQPTVGKSVPRLGGREPWLGDRDITINWFTKPGRRAWRGDPVAGPGTVFANDLEKYWQASSLMVLLGLNILLKPSAFESDQIIRADRFLDASVTKVVNSLNIRARWKKEAPPSV